METPSDPMFNPKPDCAFLPINDYNLKKELTALTHCQPDANSFTVWRSANDPNAWGFTIKSQTYKGKGQKPEINWKLTVYHKNGHMQPSQDTASFCLEPIMAEESRKLISIYNNLKF